MAKKIYVGNLNFQTTEQELTELFQDYGNIVSVDIITDKFTGRSKGFGFVEMENDEEADSAISALDGKDVSGRQIRVNEARERKNNRSNNKRY
ncbi:MAG: RNA recognition motif domain-containing protein [bacterium]